MAINLVAPYCRAPELLRYTCSTRPSISITFVTSASAAFSNNITTYCGKRIRQELPMTINFALYYIALLSMVFPSLHISHLHIFLHRSKMLIRRVAPSSRWPHRLPRPNPNNRPRKIRCPT